MMDSVARSFERSVAEARQLARLALDRFGEARCPDAASNLAFTTLVAIVPLLAIAFAIVSAFPVFQTVTDQLQAFVASTLLPEAAERVLSVYLTGFAANAAQVSLVGLAVLVITALVLVLTIEGAFEDIWRSGSRSRRSSRGSRSSRRPGGRVQRLAVYCMLVTVGPILIGTGLWLTSVVVSWSMGWFPRLDDAVLLALRLLPFLLTIAAFALLYLALPSVPVRFGDALTGGLVAGVLFEFSKRAFALYVTHIGGFQAIYGAFATLPIFLMWIYLSWLVVLAGAVLVAVMPEVRALHNAGLDAGAAPAGPVDRSADRTPDRTPDRSPDDGADRSSEEAHSSAGQRGRTDAGD